MPIISAFDDYDSSQIINGEDQEDIEETISPELLARIKRTHEDKQLQRDIDNCALTRFQAI
jgi:hypothetical protein